MENEFPSNARPDGRPGPQKKAASAPPPKEEKKDIQKIVTGTVVKQKPTLGRKFRNLFLDGQSNRDIGGNIVNTMLVPASKELFIAAVNIFLEQRLYGEIRSRVGGRPGGMIGPIIGGYGNGFTQYRTTGGTTLRAGGPAQQAPQPQQSPQMSQRGRMLHDFGEIRFSERVDAVSVLETLFELLSRYQQATVADLYGLLGMDFDFTDARFGWTDLRGSDVQYTRNGHVLILPQPIQLD